jgi:hypothetical protein
VVLSDVDDARGGATHSDELDAGHRRAWPTWAPPLLIYGAVFAVLVVVSWQVTVRYTEAASGVPPVEFRGEWFWDGWVRYDAGWYTMIADHGYNYTPGQQSEVAFFPGYPLAMRAVGGLLGNTPLGGIAVTVVCGAGALVAFHRWCRDRLDPPAALTAVLCVALYPYAYYLYGAVYGDALFLLCALLAFLAFERDHLLLAGLAGAAATATRLVGVAVVIGLVVGVLERRAVVSPGDGWRPRLDLSRLRPRDAWVLLAVSGLAAWSFYLWRRFDDPLLFSTVQESWGQHSGIGTWLKRDFFASIARHPDRFYTHGLVIQAALAGLVLLSAPLVARRFGWRYGAYVVALVAIPAVGSQDFQGVGRYMIGAFPSFALVGSLLTERPAARRLVLPLSGAILVVFTGCFANARYIS